MNVLLYNDGVTNFRNVVCHLRTYECSFFCKQVDVLASKNEVLLIVRCMPACIQQQILHADLKICIYFNIVSCRRIFIIRIVLVLSVGRKL